MDNGIRGTHVHTYTCIKKFYAMQRARYNYIFASDQHVPCTRGILCSAGREREPVTWTPTRAGRAKLSTLGCEQLFSTPGSKISPPGRDDQNVCRVCSLQTWICRHCAVDDMSGKAPPCVKARNAFFLERKLLLQNLKFLKIIPSENIIAFLTSKLTAECD